MREKEFIRWLESERLAAGKTQNKSVDERVKNDKIKIQLEKRRKMLKYLKVWLIII